MDHKAAASRGEEKIYPVGEDQVREARARKVLTDLRIIFREIQAYSKRVERHCKVSATMLWLMREVSAAGRLRISEVARALSIHQSTASNLLDKLEVRGLVVRRRGGRGEDQRVVTVALTEAGSEILVQAANLDHGPLSQALGRLSTAELSDLGAGLDRLVAVLPGGEADAGPVPPISE